MVRKKVCRTAVNSGPRATVRPLASRPALHLYAGRWRDLEALESRVLLTANSVPVPFFIVNASPQPNPSGRPGPDGFWPSQVRQAYSIDQVQFGAVAGTGAGQTIAIVDAYNAPTLVGDLHTFDQQFGLPDPTLIEINQRGGTQLPPSDPAGPGDSWALETSLDVEWAHSVAPQATIVLVLADSPETLTTAVGEARTYPGVSVVSMSWGAGEGASDTLQNATFTTPIGHTPITFIASTGDDGAFGAFGSKQLGYPAASPNVLAVGGTSLTVNPDGSYLSESGWGDGNDSGIDGGSGGGISRVEAQPLYQQGLVTQSTQFRTIPDVAMLADPETGVALYDSWDTIGGWSVIGGTSLAAPLWAGIIALANQGRTLGGGTTLDGPSETLPKIYSLSSVDFNDITTGNNGFAAGPGYDLVTGRGTPIVNQVVADLAEGLSISSLNVSPTPVISGTGVQITASNIVSELGTAVAGVTFYRESNGVPGLQIGSDTTLGAGVKNGTSWKISTNTHNFAPGQVKYYAVASDVLSNVSAPAEATLTIASPVIGSLTLAPSSLKEGGTVTLSALNVSEAAGGSVSMVKVYLESNGTPGLQTDTDTFVGNMFPGGTATAPKWTLAASTAGMIPGTYTYYAVGIDSGSTAGTPATATLTIQPPPPANDLFINAIVITGRTAAATGTNVSATKEKGEPAIGGNTGGASVWWTWTAPVSGQVRLDTASSSFDTLLSVFTGTKVTALKSIAKSDDVSTVTLTSALVFNAVAGTIYQIAVDGYKGATGAIDLNLSETPAPLNDNFASAAVLTGFSAIYTGTNLAGTRQTSEPKILNNAGGASVWFTWTASQAGLVNLDTLGSDFNTLLAVYTGAKISPLKLIASNDNAGSLTQTSAVSFHAVAGTIYQIAVDGFNGATGNLTLNLNETPAPLNDNFANATLLSGGLPLSVNASNAAATRETGEPKILNNAGGASVWFSWTAPAAGPITITTEGSDFNSLLGVYTGTKISALKLIASNNDITAGTDLASSVTFTAVSGTKYWIAIDGVLGAVGDIDLALS